MIGVSFCVRQPPIFKAYTGRSWLNLYCKTYSVRTFKQNVLVSSPMYEKQILSFPIFLMYRYMAGHAKWQNVKHIKAEKDKQKSMLCNKYVRLVTAAMKEKGPDPKQNNKLACILEEAKKNCVPAATLENALKRVNNKKFKSGIIEILGPGGFIVILEYDSDNVGDMRHTIKFICRKYSAGIFPGDGGRWRGAYQQKGMIKVTKKLNGENLDCENMLDVAIEAGAEDVQKRDDDNSFYYEFFCAPDDINTVKREIEQTFVVEESYITYLPISTVALTGEGKTFALNFLNELAEIPDVSRLYENIE